MSATHESSQKCEIQVLSSIVSLLQCVFTRLKITFTVRTIYLEGSKFPFFLGLLLILEMNKWCIFCVFVTANWNYFYILKGSQILTGLAFISGIAEASPRCCCSVTYAFCEWFPWHQS